MLFVGTKERSANSWIKEYCERVDDVTYRCLICQGKIRTHISSKSNIKRHIKNMHPLVHKVQCNQNRKEKLDFKDSEIGISFVANTDDDDENYDSEVVLEYENATKDKSTSVESESDDEIDVELNKKIKELCKKPVLSYKHNRTTCTWNFFTNQQVNDKNIYKCIFCCKDISTDSGNVSNLKRHIQLCHCKEYQRILKYAPPYDSLNHNVMKRHLRNKDDDDIGNDNDDDYTETEQKMQLENTLFNDHASSEEENDELDLKIINLCKKPVEGSVRGKTCIWNFFQNISGDNVYRCTFCSSDVTIFPKSVANLTRHLTNHHVEILRKIYKYAPSDDSLLKRKSSSNIGDITLKEQTKSSKRVKLKEEAIEAIKNTCNKPVSGKYRHKTCIWNFFECIKPTVYNCMFCKKDIVLSNGWGVSNLRRHIMTVHEKEYEVIAEYAPEKDSMRRAGSYEFLKSLASSVAAAPAIDFDKAYFEEVREGVYLCKHCDETVECSEIDLGLLFSHIQEKHPDQVILYQERTKEDEEFSLFIVKK